MARVDETYNSISEAMNHLEETLHASGLTDRDMADVTQIMREIKPGLPALEYAIDLLYTEPRLVTGKRALAVACNELYERVGLIEIIRKFGKREHSTTLETAQSDLEAFRTIIYLQNKLSRVIRKLCNISCR